MSCLPCDPHSHMAMPLDQLQWSLCLLMLLLIRRWLKNLLSEVIEQFFVFQVLRFDAFFKQTVHESPDEYYRVRVVKMYYYLEDDSIAVVEPPVQNRFA